MDILNEVEEMYANTMVEILNKVKNANDIQLLTMFRELADSSEPFQKQLLEIVRSVINQRMREPSVKAVPIPQRQHRVFPERRVPPLNEQERQEIAELVGAGESVSEISRYYHVSGQTVRNIYNKQFKKTM